MGGHFYPRGKSWPINIYQLSLAWIVSQVPEWLYEYFVRLTSIVVICPLIEENWTFPITRRTPSPSELSVPRAWHTTTSCRPERRINTRYDLASFWFVVVLRRDHQSRGGFGKEIDTYIQALCRLKATAKYQSVPRSKVSLMCWNQCYESYIRKKTSRLFVTQ